MKKIIILSLSLLISAGSFCQFNPETNSYGPMENPPPVPAATNADGPFSSLAGVPCDQNSFWAVGSGQVISLSLNGTTVTNNGAVSSCIGGSLAWCDNLDGGSFSQTFYTNSNTTRAAWYNGTGWTKCTAPPRSWILNCGGKGAFLYFTAHDSVSYVEIGIVRYTGSAYQVIYTLPDTSRAITVADLAADNDGNVWFFVGNHTTLVSDTLKVMSPSGQLLKQYPFYYNTDNAYGCFMLKGTLYIGLGGSNPVHPNTLIPVVISGNTATAGVPIAMPAVSYSDLASCNPGSPLAVAEPPAGTGFHIYHDPVNDLIRVVADTRGRFGSTLKIYNGTGQTVLKKENVSGDETISLQGMPAGIYIVEFGRTCVKIIKN
ncbi:MAG: T9SS type A sorting domain-containing protein [bacterium]